jgi:hypothetical protein
MNNHLIHNQIDKETGKMMDLISDYSSMSLMSLNQGDTGNIPPLIPSVYMPQSYIQAPGSYSLANQYYPPQAPAYPTQGYYYYPYHQPQQVYPYNHPYQNYHQGHQRNVSQGGRGHHRSGGRHSGRSHQSSLTPKYKFVDTLEDCVAATEAISALVSQTSKGANSSKGKDKKEKAKAETTHILSIDLEGVDLQRTGEICILQIATSTQFVYLFDITRLGSKAFHDSGLAEKVLCNDSFIKLFFDGRKDMEALFYQFNVRVSNILDMQVLFARAQQEMFAARNAAYANEVNSLNFSAESGSISEGSTAPSNPNESPTKGFGALYLPGMMKALKASIPYRDFVELEKIKSDGKFLFLPPENNRHLNTTPSPSNSGTNSETNSVAGHLENENTKLDSNPSTISSPAPVQGGVTGGSYEIWKKRPLPEALIQYCILDVVQLYRILERFKDVMTRKELREISENRIADVIALEEPYPNGHEYWRLINF